MAAMALACLLSTCVTIDHAVERCATNEQVTYHQEASILCIKGRFTADRKIRDSVLAQPINSRTLLVIESDGGYIRDAIDIVERLDEHGYDVVVPGMCASACAQFLFIGADRKYITRNGLVAIHGGPKSDEQIDALGFDDQVKANLKNERDRFVKFYADRKIPLGITRDFPDDLMDKLARGEIVFWVPKVADFEKYGVARIETCNATHYQSSESDKR